jgi:hypothetical protein
MGKSYKQNDRHFTKGGSNFTKPRKHGGDRRIKFDKIKQVIRPYRDDLYDDMRGLS